MSDWRQITRRDFVRDSALGALVLGLGATAPHGSFAAAGDKSIVALIRDEKVLNEANAVDAATARKMLDEAVKAATGESSAAAAWKKLIKPDDVVGIVPTTAIAPTHPEMIAAVTDAIKEAGIPADRIQNVQRNKAAVEKCTALISMPGLKTHMLTGMGTVMKNYISFGTKPAKTYHGENNGAMGEIWLEPLVKGKTRIIIVDAIQAAYAGGPQKDPKNLWGYKGLIVSTDPVAAETISLRILQAKRKAVKGADWEITPAPVSVAAADKEYHLGTSDPAKIALKIIGWEKEVLVSA
jgi:uncharacterized protein (DUF362 family)